MSKKAAIFVGNGTEPVECIAPADVMRRGGVDVTMVSVMRGTEAGLAHGINFNADILQDEFNSDSYDMIVVPGGMEGVNNLSKSPVLADALKQFASEGRHIASICAGPTILAENGVLDGRKATCYPGCEDVFPEGVYQDVIGVVVDDNIITASGPGIALDFGVACLRALMGDETADSVAKGMLIK